MIISPGKYFRRQIGERVYYVNQLARPDIVYLNEDADTILRHVVQTMRSEEVLVSLGDVDLTLDELEEFLVECARVGLLESEQGISLSTQNAPQDEGAKAAKELEDYSAVHRIPIGGSIELTTRCNLRCVHCYLGKERQANQFLSLTRWLGLLDRVIERGCLWMEVTGGDPLLAPEFPGLYRYLVEHGVIVTVLTNGTTITPELIDLFLSMPPAKIEVSIYGCSKDVYESVTQVEGSYSRFLSGLEDLVSARANLELKAIILKSNQHELAKMRELAESFGIFFRFSGEIHEELDGSPEPDAYRLSPQEVAQMDFSDPERAKEIRAIAATRQCIKNPEAYQCRAGINGFHIGASGMLHPCIAERSVAYSLLEHTFDEVWDHLLPQSLSIEYPEGSRCISCDKHSMCKICPPRSRMATGNQFLPSPFLCELADERIKLAEGR